MIKLGELATARAAFGRPFCRKHQHASQGAAEAQLRALRAREGARAVDGLRTYECRACPAGTWHVGHVSDDGGGR